MAAAATEEKSIQTLVHEAMERHGGDRKAAAEELGMSLQDIKNKIYESPNLRRRWAKDEAAPPDDIETLTRNITTDDERLARAIEAEGDRLKKGLNALGLTEREVATTLAAQKFNREHFSSGLDIINAGVIRTSIKLQTHLEQIESRLEVVRYKLLQMGDKYDDDRDLWVQEESQLALQYSTGVDQLRKILATSFEGSKTLALIKFKLAGGGKGIKRAKPGFQSIGEGTEQ